MKPLFLAFALFISCNAAAERDFGLYVGAGMGFVEAEAVDAFGQDVEFKVGELIGGAYWRWIGAEVRQGVSLEDETVNLGTDPNTGTLVIASSEIEFYRSTYLRLQFANDVARIYGLYGTTEIETLSSIRSDPPSRAQGSGSSYGAGVGVDVNDHLAFNLEYRVLLDDDQSTFTMTGLNVDFRF